MVLRRSRLIDKAALMKTSAGWPLARRLARRLEPAAVPLIVIFFEARRPGAMTLVIISSKDPA